MKASTMFKFVEAALTTHGPAIATGFGIACAAFAAVKAVKETPKAMKILEEKKEEEGVDNLTPVQIVKATWKCYLPSVIIFLLAVVTTIGGHQVTTRRAAAFATAYSLSEEARKEYQAAAKAVLGDGKEQEIRDKVAQDKLDRNPLRQDAVVPTGVGNVLCFDALSGRPFMSTRDRIEKVVVKLNQEMMNGYQEWISVNDYYSAIGLSPTDAGDLLGWNVKTQIDPDFRYASGTGDYEGVPCLIVGFNVSPRYDYTSLM